MNTSTDELNRLVIGSAIEVHRQPGPGLLECAYEQALATIECKRAHGSATASDTGKNKGG